MKVAIVYFSATGVTKRYAERIGNHIASQAHAIDFINVTPLSSRQKDLGLDGYDGVFFGFPVFADFAPGVMNDWIPTLNGGGTRCSMFFTYGGRTAGYAHFHTRRSPSRGMRLSDRMAWRGFEKMCDGKNCSHGEERAEHGVHRGLVERWRALATM